MAEDTPELPDRLIETGSGSHRFARLARWRRQAPPPSGATPLEASRRKLQEQARHLMETVGVFRMDASQAASIVSLVDMQREPAQKIAPSVQLVSIGRALRA